MTAELVQLPTPERLRKHKIEIAQEQIQDANQGIGRPFRIIDVLTLLERRGTITKSMKVAGDRFRDDYDLAALDPLKAADPSRIPGLPSNPDYSRSMMEARDRVWKAFQALGGKGSLLADCMEWVVGRQRSIAGWAFTAGPGSVSMRAEAASGILQAGLDLLAKLYDEMDGGR